MDTVDMQQNLHRSLPHGLRNVVGELELRGLTLVSAERVARYAGVPVGSSAAYDIIRRLVGTGWLSPLPVKGHYEFLPARAGRYSREDALDPLRILFLERGVEGQVALTGAAFLRGFADRAPRLFDVLVPRTRTIWTSLRARYHFHQVALDRIFGAESFEGVPVSTRERLIVDVALWPAEVGASLRARDHWLAAVLELATTETVVEMLRRLDSASATARAGYLANAFGRPDIADAVGSLGRSRVTVPLIPGIPSSPAARRDRRFNVADQIGVASIS